MKRTALFAALVLAAGVALANHCPNEMRAIDAALPNAKGKTAAEMNEIKRLRAEGERLHKEGKHAESLVALEKAKSMLGIK